MRVWVIGLSLLALAAGGFVSAQDKEAGEAAAADVKHSDHHLEKLVLPMALSPDLLVKWVLDASTHPGELARAGDYVFQGVRSAKFDARWPRSIRELVRYPLVLWELDAHLSWTVRVGNAYKAQPKAVVAAINEVRRMALDNGNLLSNKYQTVEVKDDLIRITPRNTKSMHVAYYDAEVILYPNMAHRIRYVRGTMKEPPKDVPRKQPIEREPGVKGEPTKGKPVSRGYTRDTYPRPRYVYPNRPTGSLPAGGAYPTAGDVYANRYAVPGAGARYTYPLIHSPGYHPAYSRPPYQHKYPYSMPSVEQSPYKTER